MHLSLRITLCPITLCRAREWVIFDAVRHCLWTRNSRREKEVLRKIQWAIRICNKKCSKLGYLIFCDFSKNIFSNNFVVCEYLCELIRRKMFSIKLRVEWYIIWRGSAHGKEFCILMFRGSRIFPTSQRSRWHLATCRASVFDKIYMLAKFQENRCFTPLLVKHESTQKVALTLVLLKGKILHDGEASRSGRWL